MKVGIVGLPNVGKSTLFNCLSQSKAQSENYPFCTIDPNVSIVNVPDKCTECMGFHEEPQCAAVCPVDCCVPDENNVETENELLSKQKFMHE